jgi:hypothetical protein
MEQQLALARAEVWEWADQFFDALQDENNPLTAGQLIFHFQEQCRKKAQDEQKAALDKKEGGV